MEPNMCGTKEMITRTPIRRTFLSEVIVDVIELTEDDSQKVLGASAVPKC